MPMVCPKSRSTVTAFVLRRVRCGAQQRLTAIRCGWMYLTTTWISTDARRAVAVNIESASSPLLCKGLPTGEDADFKFAEPWEAKIFAIIVGLSKDGHFSWADWVECFSKEVAGGPPPEPGGGHRPRSGWRR